MQKALGNLPRGLLFIVSAPAGTGKTTLVQMLTHEYPCVVASISYTTRAPRSGEVNGVHYNFINDAEFSQLESQGDFLETAQLYGQHGYRYGTSRIWVENQLSLGKHVVLVIDTQGAQQVREKIEVISIFVAPPSLEVLEQRLVLRNTEGHDSIKNRLERANEELKQRFQYNYYIVNDDLAIAFQVLRSIFIAEEHKFR